MSTLAPFDQLTLSALQTAMVAAMAKHGERTPLNPDMSDTDKLPVLVEEVGEVARAMTYDEGSRDALIKELVQTAAMALSWAQSLDTSPDDHGAAMRRLFPWRYGYGNRDNPTPPEPYRPTPLTVDAPWLEK